METYLGSTELTKIKINSYYRINVVDLDAYSVNQPIGNQRRNHPAMLLVRKCTDVITRRHLLFHYESVINSRIFFMIMFCLD